MTHSLYARLARLGRWPRRVAALLCLALAAASALSGQHPSPAAAGPRPARAGVAAGLADGQLAVPVTISDSTASVYLHGGDHVDLYAGPGSDLDRSQPAALLGSRLRVLAVLSLDAGTQETGGTHVIVAADRVTAARIAGTGGQQILAVLDQYP